jgi:FKBP-type peptidyl-prolyl cis-trans isomerase
MQLLALFLICLIGASSADQISYMKRVGAKFLKEKALEPDVITLMSGMLVKILKESTKENAKSPRAGDSCEVTYSGTLKDGTKFDSGMISVMLVNAYLSMLN